MTNLHPVLAIGVEESQIARVFLAIATVIAVARVMGVLAKVVRQPPVVGEIIGGIMLGPTLLGALPGELDELLFPENIRGFLTVIANLGLIIFMFIVGLELDSALIKGKERVAGVISVSSIALPMTLGVVLAVYLHDSHDVVDGTKVKLLPFALFIGAAMSITAFPVLARIMIDRGMYRTQIGALTLACAAVDDVLAWSLLAIVLAVVKTGSFLSWEFPRIVGLSIVFSVAMALVVRPLLARLVPAHKKAGRLTPNLVAIVIGGVLVASFITSEIGIHHILGAFVFGAMMPRQAAHAMNLELLDRIEQVTVVLLLPVFFVITGLSVDIGALQWSDVGVLLLILLTAVAGKFIGATVAARAQGIRPWRRAAAIGSLMNTRGLTELIILSVGREAGVLDDRLFTMLVIMAVVTTVMTEPALRLFYPDRMLSRDVAAAQKQSLGSAGAYRVFVVVGEAAGAESELAVDVACDVVGNDRPSEVVLSRLVRLGQAPEFGVGARLADITASMDGLSALEQRVTATGISARVLTRFSSEPMRDLIGQVAASDVDLLLIGAAGTDSPARTADELDRVVAVFERRGARRGRRSVLLMAADGDNGIAALEVAVRIARSRAEPLRIVVGSSRAKKWGATVTSLEQRGLAAVLEVSDTAGSSTTVSADLVVVAGDALVRTASTKTLLRVYSPPDMGRTSDDVLRDLDAVAADITGEASPEAATPNETKPGSEAGEPRAEAAIDDRLIVDSGLENERR